MTDDDEDRTLPADLGALLQTGRQRTALRARRPEITLHQLRIFWAVAHSETLTRAAKQLGLAQPSLSQQLSKLETTVGTRLFRRHSNEMTLTEAGTYLLPRAEQILRNMQDLEDGLGQFSGGHRVTVRLAGINSVLRVVLPAALTSTQSKFPDIDFDIQESAPADILEMLYGRRVSIGLLAANSVAEASVGFLQIPIIEDPYVLVVPEQLNLDDIADPRELAPPDWAMLNRSIQFIFGTQHAKRVADWYDQMLPEHRVVAQCRSFEVAIGLVRAGSGICLAPALSTVSGSASLDGVRLYRINADARRIVALVASQYRRQEPYASLIDALQAAGETLALPGIRPTPPFLDRASLSEF
ncbi:LysR family transcriptional regulator [Devosia sp. LjRoot16]|uniref:LysR family transcriptional regulator n=1 Tax=Devosia sp. LjRoot16 TaxID=3342271 RepID=UPI003ED1413E